MVKSKMSLLIAILFAIVFFNVYSQDNASVTEVESVTDDVSVSSYEQTPFGVNSITGVSDISTNNRSNTVWTVVEVVIILILIIVAVYFIMKFFARRNNFQKSDDDFLRRVSTLNLGVNKSVEIVTLMDKGYILGVTESNINLISQIDDKELVDALNLNFDRKNDTKKPYNFSDMLELFTKGGKKQSNVFSQAESDLDSISRRNQNREEN